MSGYKTKTASVRSQIAGAGGAGMAGNILVGGIIGIGVDATSGAMNDLTPNPLLIVLQPNDPIPPITQSIDSVGPQSGKETAQ